MSRRNGITEAGRRRRRHERRAARAGARSQVFALLARALRHPDAGLFAALRDGRWAAELAAAARASGIPREDTFLAELDRLPEALPARLADLQAWHTALFSSGAVCQHQESDYAASHVFQKADLMADVAGFYAAFGLRIAHRQLADFLGAELEFLYFVGWKEAYALRRRHVQAAAICREAQQKFLAEHLGVWVTSFREKMERSAAGRLYVLLASLIESFVRAQGIEPRPAPARPRSAADPLLEQPACPGCS